MAKARAARKGRKGSPRRRGDTETKTAGKRDPSPAKSGIRASSHERAGTAKGTKRAKDGNRFNTGDGSGKAVMPRALGRLEGVPLGAITPTKWNPRSKVNTSSPRFQELLESVKASGVHTPVLVRPNGDGYELLAGMRRFEAARLAGLERIPAEVREMTDAEAFTETFFENAFREDLTPAEEGRAVAILLEKHGGDRRAAAAALGKSEQWVEQRARLQALSPAWQALIEDPTSWAFGLSVGHLVLIARLDPELQDYLLIMDGFWEIQENARTWSVTQLEQYLNRQLLHRIASAPWPLEDATLDAAAGACAECAKRSSCQGLLFISTEAEPARRKKDQCLDTRCWERKASAWMKRRVEEERRVHGDTLRLVTSEGTDWQTSQELEQAFGQVERAGLFTPAKEKAKDAVPALIVHGQGAGELHWVKPRPGVSCTGAGAAAPGAQSGPKSLEERRKGLESKRLFEVLKEAAQAVALTPLETVADRLIPLAATFGTIRNHTECAPEMWNRSAELPGDEDAAALWSQVRDVLVCRIHYTGPITQVPSRYAEELKCVAQLCGIDLAPMRAKAAETYPEPKSWAKVGGSPRPAPNRKAGRRRHGGTENGTAITAKGTKHAKDGNGESEGNGKTAKTSRGKAVRLGVALVDELKPEWRVMRESESGSVEIFKPRTFPVRPSRADAEEDLKEYAATHAVEIVNLEPEGTGNGE